MEVYFDDFKVTQIKSPVIQSDDYYPFGLRYNSYSRENSLPNKSKLFQGQEHIDDLGLNWDSFKWRNHQPEIGRFFNVDPLSEKYYYNSVYAFSENKVVAHIELEGLESVEISSVKAEIGKKELKLSAEGSIQQDPLSLPITPTITLGEGGVKPGVEKSTLKDDNPANKDNKSVSDIKKDNPNFDSKKLTENIQKNLKNTNELASTQGPGRQNNKSASENKALKVEMEKKIKAEDQNAKEKASENKKDLEKKENK